MLIMLESSEMSPASIENGLRSHRIPIISRVERDRVVIDLRTVALEEEAIILDAIKALAQPALETAASVDM
jgi:hypothetical protein